jgi:ABC-type hemin transport system ATPase subunit
MLKDGAVAHAGRPEDVLTRESIRAVFGVDAVVGRHPETRMLYVLPALARER